MSQSPPHLLHIRLSHYNEKVRWALDFKGWPHTREAVIPGFHVPRVRRLTGQHQVPVMILDSDVIVGSSQILAEIERIRPDPPLFPLDVAEKSRALELQTFFDDEVAPDLRRLFWATYLEHPSTAARLATDGFSPAARIAWRALWPVMQFPFRANLGADTVRLGLARQRLGSVFDRLEAEIGSSGYLVGDRFTVADLAVASVMSAIIRPPEFSYPLPEPWPPELVELRQGVANTVGSKWVLDMFRRHRGKSAEIDRDSAPP